MTDTLVRLACDALPRGSRVIQARGVEGVNVLSCWELRVLCEDAPLNAKRVVGASATLELVDEPEGTSRAIGLILLEAAREDDGRDGNHFTIVLGPPEALLTLRSGYRVFLDKTTKDIVAEVLREAGIPAAQVEWRLAGAYLKRLQCTQYGETEWSFIERLLAEEGVSYWFETDDDGEPRIIFADNPRSHEPISGSPTIPYEDPGGVVPFRSFGELEVVEKIATTAVHVLDYNVRNPDVPIEGQVGAGPAEYFEYPAHTLTNDMAQSRAAVRLEQLQRLQTHANGRSNCIRLEPGRLVTIEGSADDWMNDTYLVVRVEHEIASGSRSDVGVKPYMNRVVMVPHKSAAFRPELARGAPRVDGLELATTTGPAGAEVHVDDLGRLKIRFPWDRSGITDDRSSWWVRCMQMNMDGSMLLPRVGWEVPVAYIDGNPDHPVVLGRHYNATAIVPYGLPTHAATSSFQSASSPGGGSTNEIRMADGAGSQELFIHASKDHNVSVGGSATTKVGANETHDVNLSLIAHVNGSQSVQIGASQSVDVGTDYSTAVKGARTELVGGMELVNVTANRLVAVAGAYVEMIGGFYGIQCNQANVSVNGAFLELVGSAMGLAGGIGVSETVVAARTELVGASKTLLAAGAFSEKVRGAKFLTAGATTETADAKVVTSTKAGGKVSVGGSATLTASGPFLIEAPQITIEASSLDAGAFALSGGALRLKSGKANFKGTVKRRGGAKLEA